jgi:hypothetical protein
MSLEPLQVKAGGTIYECRFVTVSTAADNAVLQCSATSDLPCGISGRGQRLPPVQLFVTTAQPHAIVGENCLVHYDGVAPVQYGAAVTHGDLLGPDTNGKAIKVTPTSAYLPYGAIALFSGVDGDIRDVLVLPARYVRT